MTACQLQGSAAPMPIMAILQRDSEKVNLPPPVRKGLIFVKKFGIMKQKETVVFYII
mgnify:CR=1 FL=1